MPTAPLAFLPHLCQKLAGLALGLSFADIRNKTPEAQLELLATKFSSIKDGADKDAIAIGRLRLDRLADFETLPAWQAIVPWPGRKAKACSEWPAERDESPLF